MFYPKVKGNWLQTEQGHYGDHLTTPCSAPTALPLHNTSLFTSVLRPFSSSGSLRSMQSAVSSPLVYYAANWWHEWDGYNIKRQEAKVGGTVGGGGGMRRWREWRQERKTERQREKGRDLFSLEEGVSILHVRSKLGWQGSDKFCACVWVFECACQSKGFW